MGYSFRLTARVLLYAPSHRQNSTYHGRSYHGATSRSLLSTLTCISASTVRCEQILAQSKQVRVFHPRLGYFSFQPVLHDWCNKGRGMCYPVCGMMHINEPLLLIGKSSPCGSSGFPLSLCEWSFIICLTPYNCK